MYCKFFHHDLNTAELLHFSEDLLHFSVDLHECTFASIYFLLFVATISVSCSLRPYAAVFFMIFIGIPIGHIKNRYIFIKNVITWVIIECCVLMKYNCIRRHTHTHNKGSCFFPMEIHQIVNIFFMNYETMSIL